MFVLIEAHGVQGDFGAYLVRSLLSEGKLVYETVMKTPEGLKAVVIEREGPTGLIVSTTAARLHPENETRMMSIVVDDSRDQTKRVMRGLAREASLSPSALVEAWQALQVWLEQGEHRVEVPFAGDLAEAIPPLATRFRRDFGTLLALIKAHALLHQACRPRDAERRVVATLDDYRVVRELVLDLMAEGAAARVSGPIRETVDAVRHLVSEKGGDVSVAQVAAKLRVDPATALRRLRVGISMGYLVNRQTRRYQKWELNLGDSMPEDLVILPTVAQLEACTIAGVAQEMPTPPPRVPDDEGERERIAREQARNDAAVAEMMEEISKMPWS